MDSAIIEVGLGLIMIYFVMSIVQTQVNDLMVNSLNLRAENLRWWFHQTFPNKEFREKLLENLHLLKTPDPNAPKPNPIQRFFTWLRHKLLRRLIPGADTFEFTTDVSNVTSTVFSQVLTGILLPDASVAAASHDEA